MCSEFMDEGMHDRTLHACVIYLRVLARRQADAFALVKDLCNTAVELIVRNI